MQQSSLWCCHLVNGIKLTILLCDCSVCIAHPRYKLLAMKILHVRPYVRHFTLYCNAFISYRPHNDVWMTDSDRGKLNLIAELLSIKHHYYSLELFNADEVCRYRIFVYYVGCVLFILLFSLFILCFNVYLFIPLRTLLSLLTMCAML